MGLNGTQDISLERLQTSTRNSSESDDHLLNDIDDDQHDTDNQHLLEHQHTGTKTLLKEGRRTLIKSGAINLIWILTWYTFATFLSIYNKWMFSADHYNFQFPLFVTSVHMIVQFIFAGVSLFSIPRLRPKTRPTSKEYVFKVFPCALATSLDIGLSNLSLKTITLSFYTMCKSSTLAFVLVFAFLFKLESPSLRLIGIIIIITIGVVLMVSDETEFVLSGFIQVMAASAFGGLRWALTEVLLRKESMGLTNPFASIFFLAPAQAFILVVIAGVVEGYGSIFSSVFFIDVAEAFHTMGIVLFGGALAFCMIMSEFFLIKRTSVMTLSVCGIFKEVATIFISTIVFGDKLTVINIFGLCITLFGIGLYNWLKIRAASLSVQKDLHHHHHHHLLVDEQGTILHDMENDENEDNSDHQRQHISAANTSIFELTSRDHHYHPKMTSLYSMSAESTPVLLADAGLSTAYQNNDDDDDDDDLNLNLTNKDVNNHVPTTHSQGVIPGQ
ncbi:triose-phosphate transporter family-domain-containing protein [Halteromyces radiatus]|uniref:triose-phosphate transporter family-domain-containing protein n=1 Tax=Halteromyces radiatus TaxID=101107 RepID=UPI00221EA807|nr:triose-phosphate transporter family-domain-containing protein [Halteromyces radiatus]KAI8100044.1 triose-phosphate transporter family-domain-containing protein [Halteromyces radiatus]